MTVQIIGAGLAGCEAAWQAARLGADVILYEMKPAKMTPAHSYKGFAELVCSNSLRSADIASGVGLLKEELSRMDSLIMEAAKTNAVPAGGALAVDRTAFSDYITKKICTHPRIRVVEEEVVQIPVDGITVIATGPLTSEPLAREIAKLVGDRQLSFYDAAAPIVDFSTIDMDRAFFASRYGKGTPDYINCPMNKDEYAAFYEALIHAEEAQLHDFEQGEKFRVFEGCMPVEVMARRGRENLFFAGQMTGVEGYVESAASGFVAGLCAARRGRGNNETSPFPATTMIGAMAHYVSAGGTADFQPMNANFGIMQSPPEKIRGGKKARHVFYADRALEEIARIMKKGLFAL